MLILSVFFSISASAYDVEVDGVCYNLISKGKIAEVTYREQYINQNNYNNYSGDIKIASYITVNKVEYSVTSIGKWAFYNCTDLKSVTIPNSVTSIGDYVLNCCDGIKNTIIVNDLFVYLPKTYTGHYSIPENITKIIGGAFDDCSGLTSVTIPNSVTSIGSHAFRNCN